MDEMVAIRQTLNPAPSLVRRRGLLDRSIGIHGCAVPSDLACQSLSPPLLLGSPAGIEMFHKILDKGEAGDQMGTLVRNIKRDQIKRGMMLCRPNTYKANNHVKAQVGAPCPPWPSPGYVRNRKILRFI